MFITLYFYFCIPYSAYHPFITIQASLRVQWERIRLQLWATGDAGSIPESGRSLEEGTAAHSSILAWRIPWTEEPGGLQSIGLQRVGCDWSGLACTHITIQSIPFTHFSLPRHHTPKFLFSVSTCLFLFGLFIYFGFHCCCLLLIFHIWVKSYGICNYFT